MVTQPRPSPAPPGSGPRRWLLACLLAVPAACGAPTPEPPASRPAPSGPAQPVVRDPVIPSSNARLEGMTTTDPQQAFVAEPAFYGEHTWDDVRMRVVGHIAAAGRDLARAAVARGDLEDASRAYGDLHRRLDAVSATTATAGPIRSALSGAAKRDAALCAWLAEDGPTPTVPGPGVAALRYRYAAIARATQAGLPVAKEVRELEQAASPLLAPRPDLSLDAFQDFDQRHALRIRLVEAYADEVDPFSPTDPWGYRTADEGPRQVRALLDAARILAAEGAAGRSLPALLTLPAARIDQASVPAQEIRFTAEDLGALPTGDSLIDVAGWPGPSAIGRLAVRSLEDPAYRTWLEETANRLNGAPDAEVPTRIGDAVSDLNRNPEGSRYYNIKQVRNAGVRTLARRGRYPEALQILATHRPLRQHDWACPDRDAILLVIEGRLLLLAGDPSATDTLHRALAAAEAFLARVDEAERTGPPAPPSGGPRPGGPPP